MAKIHVKEDWGKEADENPFPVGRMMTVDGGLVYVFVGQPPPPPLAAAGRRGVEVEEQKKPVPTLPLTAAGRRRREVEEQKKPTPTLPPPQPV